MSSGCGNTSAPTGAFQAEIMAFELMRGYFLSVPDGLPLPNQPSSVAWVLSDGERDLV